MKPRWGILSKEFEFIRSAVRSAAGKEEMGPVASLAWADVVQPGRAGSRLGRRGVRVAIVLGLCVARLALLPPHKGSRYDVCGQAGNHSSGRLYCQYIRKRLGGRPKERNLKG